MWKGLLPNLMDAGRCPRYNCRDSVWWFLLALQEFCNECGAGLLQESVPVLFDDDGPPRCTGIRRMRTVAQCVVAALTAAFNGIYFREFNAGTQIDEHMKDDGFNIRIWTDPSTGLVVGGSSNNCGTWMDKMGSSAKAGNKGVPATPRDGCAIEIGAMLYSTLAWWCRLGSEGEPVLSSITVELENVEKFARLQWPISRNAAGPCTLEVKHWCDRVRSSFEKHFWIPLGSIDDEKFACNTSLVHRRGIYKDCVLSSQQFTEYQLRPNVCIAIAVVGSHSASAPSDATGG